MAVIGDKAKHRRSIDRRLREVREAREVLERIDELWLWEMQRRREQLATADGYGSVSLNDGGRGSSDTTPTERAALAGRLAENEAGVPLHLGCRRPHFVKVYGKKARVCSRCGREDRDHVADPIGSEVEAVFEFLDTATQALRTLGKKYEVIVNAADGRRGRQPLNGQCLACGGDVTGYGEDRIKSGYGPCCWKAWKRWSAQQDEDGVDQSHVVFRVHRRAELAQRADEEAAATTAQGQGA